MSSLLFYENMEEEISHLLPGGRTVKGKNGNCWPGMVTLEDGYLVYYQRLKKGNRKTGKIWYAYLEISETTPGSITSLC